MSLVLFQSLKRWARATFSLLAHGHAMPSPLPSVVVTTADQTLVGTAYTDVTGLSFSVAANKTYLFEFLIIADADAAGTGIDVAVNGPASPTALYCEQEFPRSTGVNQFLWSAAYNNDSANTGSGGTVACLYKVRGVLRNGANAGTLAARIKREAVGTGPNVRIGSCGFLWLLN